MVRKLKKLEEKEVEKNNRNLRNKMIKKSKQSVMTRILEAINETINKNAIKKLEKYLGKYLGKYKYITKWIICSDYCIGDKNKKTNVSSFVIIPYKKELKNILEEVKLKKDIKAIGKKIPQESIDYLNNNNFVLNFIHSKELFTGLKFNRDIERNSIDETIKLMENRLDDCTEYDRIIRDLKKVREELNKNSFNMNLYKNIHLNALFFAYTKHLIEKKLPCVDMVSWLSDRDKMISYMDGCIFSISMNYTSLIRELFKQNKNIRTKVLTILQKDTEKPFYDPLIRIPDYYCGTLAEIDEFSNEFLEKKISDEKNDYKHKYNQMMTQVLRENENIINLRVGSKEKKIHGAIINIKKVMLEEIS